MWQYCFGFIVKTDKINVQKTIIKLSVFFYEITPHTKQDTSPKQVETFFFEQLKTSAKLRHSRAPIGERKQKQILVYFLAHHSMIKLYSIF